MKLSINQPALCHEKLKAQALPEYGLIIAMISVVVLMALKEYGEFLSQGFLFSTNQVMTSILGA